MAEDSSPPLLLTRAKVCQLLSITVREFYALVEAQKLHPLYTANRQIRISLAEAMAVKSELSSRAITVPHEKFIMSCTFFCPNSIDLNSLLVQLKFPRIPLDYAERLRLQAQSDPGLTLIKEKSLQDFYRTLGRADEIFKREDLRLMVEALTMIGKGEQEISQMVQAKYGRTYGKDDILRFVEYFYNWKTMDPASASFYIEYLSGREKVIKKCAYNRADPFIHYALGIDFGGEIADLLERSCLGLVHKLNFFIDGMVYGEGIVTQRDLMQMAEIISNLLGAAKSVRDGKVPKGKQKQMADTMLPQAVGRGDFFEKEKSTTFGN